MPRKPPIWQLPALIAGSIAALTALGTGIVMASKYIQLPERIEAAEQKNVQQDEAITKLTAIEETWQKLYQQQQKSVVREVADDGEIKVMLMDGKKLCCNGTDCWAWSKKTKCVR